MWCLILNLIDAPNSTNSGVFHNLVVTKIANNVTMLSMLFVYICR